MGTLTRFNLEIIKQDWPGDVFVEIKHPSDNNTFSESYVRRFYLNYFSVQNVDEVLSDPIVSSAETVFFWIDSITDFPGQFNGEGGDINSIDAERAYEEYRKRPKFDLIRKNPEWKIKYDYYKRILSDLNFMPGRYRDGYKTSEYVSPFQTPYSYNQPEPAPGPNFIKSDLEKIWNKRSDKKDIILCDDLRMYLNYDYEGGDWDKSYKLRKPVSDKEYYNNFGNYKNTHSIIKYNTDHGYVLLAPMHNLGERKNYPQYDAMDPRVSENPNTI